MLTDILEKAKTGDMKAFSALYDASYDRVYRYIFHRVLDTLKTEDIISEVYMKILKGLKRFRGKSEGEYYAWVFQISYTTIIDGSRSEIGIDSLEELIWEPSHTPTDTIDAQDKIAEIMNYLQTLSEKEQMIVTMRIWDDLSYEEIADIMGESLVNIRKIFSRTLLKITANISALCVLIFIILHVS